MISKINEFLHQLSAKLMALSVKNQWLLQRLTAILLVPLAIWLGVFFHYSLAASFQEARVWLMRPLNLGCLFVFLGIVVVHSHLGLKVIIEDYIADQPLQEKLIFASLWGFGLLGVSVVGAVIILFFRV